ncbi:MAG: N-6 DNA methylase, partial [Planctomycetota bacterium]|nr:N-6 DNA methylase [Planctomycetota bacterium]MDI6787665.1 N-6 DNA methylase [Planctomycetota bacterium]
RQLGQFLTPTNIAQKIVEDLRFTKDDKVLEPSMGKGSFIIPLIEKFLNLYSGTIQKRLDQILKNNIYGVELDKKLFIQCLNNIKNKWGYLPPQHNFICADFFRCDFLLGKNRDNQKDFNQLTIPFTYIIGNPPFGGTIDAAIQDELDYRYGFRNGEKIKKETYSFFIVKSIDMLTKGGKLVFICSDTFLTIKTMRGLRRFLMCQGEVKITDLEHFSDETTYPMVVLNFVKSGYTDSILVNGKRISRDKIEMTGNFSWRVTDDLAKYFNGPFLGDYMIASSGMTVGKNEYFVREIINGKIIEPYEFQFFDDPITLKKEVSRARLGKLSARRFEEIQSQEAAGVTRRNVKIIRRQTPLEIKIPHRDYCYYNKGSNRIIYAHPTHVVYWENNGDAVLTFKKNGNWYLNGVGGQPYFKREGLTWQLIAQNINIRYLPEGYILDSGSPCAFLRRGMPHDEMYFILGWTLTQLCNRILKEVINHTKNIQSKDFERLPYPFWVPNATKQEVITHIKQMVKDAQDDKRFTRNDPEIEWLEEKFTFNQSQVNISTKIIQHTSPLSAERNPLNTLEAKKELAKQKNYAGVSFAKNSQLLLIRERPAYSKKYKSNKNHTKRLSYHK